MIKLHHVDDNPIPQECVAEDKLESESRKVGVRNTIKVRMVEVHTG